MNSCGALTKITSRLFLSDLRSDTERDYGNDRGFVVVAFKESM